MRQKPLSMLTISWLILGTLSATARPTARAASRTAPRRAFTPALLKSVALDTGDSGKGLLLAVDGRYAYKMLAVDSRTVMIDLKGVKPSGVSNPARVGQWKEGWLAGYRLIEYTSADHQPVVRLEVTLRESMPVEAQRQKAGLRLSFGAPGAGTGACPYVGAADCDRPAAAPATQNGRGAKSSVLRPVVVKGVVIKSATAEETAVDVLASGAPSYEVRRLENPARIVVDFAEARYLGGQRVYDVHSADVKSVRIAQFQAAAPAIFRVVADVTRDLNCEVHAQAGGVRIELTARHQTPLVEKRDPARVSVPSPPAPPHDTAKPSPEKATPSPAVEAGVVPQSVSPGDVAASPRIQISDATPESLRAAKAARILAATDSAPAAVQGQAPAAPAKLKYTGEPISLNLKDVDLKDFFRLIHEISGLNIIVDPNVEGKVTLVLDSVPWDQALDIVMKDNRLDKVLEGNVLRIAKVETLAAEQEGVKKLAEAREEAQPLVTVFRHVNYTKASVIQTMLKGWVGGGALTKRGSVLVDDRLNTLIISDIQTQIPIIESIMSKLDVKAKQVSIEARIVLASSTFSRTLSSILSAATKNRSGSTAVAGATGTGVSAAIAGAPPSVTTATTSGFGVFAISNSSSRYIIDAAISAAETKSLAKTISRPSIVTQNNVAGTVTQGTQIPIQTTINNTISITYVQASLTLTVTPQVTEDGNVFLVITVTNASPGAVLTGAGPSITTQSATTQVLVPDGGTVVFGGVTVTLRNKAATYVPLIGSIPVVGHLFKTSTVSDTDNELLFFVSPKVLPA